MGFLGLDVIMNMVMLQMTEDAEESVPTGSCWAGGRQWAW